MPVYSFSILAFLIFARMIWTGDKKYKSWEKNKNEGEGEEEEINISKKIEYNEVNAKDQDTAFEQ